MNYIARIRCNADGRIAEFHGHDELPNKEDGYFQWEDGNYDCDCARHNFFQIATGGVQWKYPCGVKDYAVLDITFENGDVFYPDGRNV